MDYSRHYNKRQTPQTEAIPGKDMVENSAGGYAFAVDDWTRLNRFLVLGTEGGTYYATERKLTIDNAKVVDRCIKADGPRVVRTITELSDSGRAPKNDPALFALAMCAAAEDTTTRQLAFAALPKVARIGTHLFHFAQYANGLRGLGGRGIKRAIANWYLERGTDKLALQAVKYRSRDGWSHRDLLRLSHPKADNEVQNNIFNYITQGNVVDNLPQIILATQEIHNYVDFCKDAANKVGNTTLKIDSVTLDKIASIIVEHQLPREVVPTELLKYMQIWAALLPHMPLTAMLRNLNKMTVVGLLQQLSAATGHVCTALTDKDALKRARIHPLSVVQALRIYSRGYGDRGGLAWSPVPQILTALNDSFYLAFDHLEPTNKRWVLAVDVSGSMDGGEIAGMRGMTPRDGSIVMTLATLHTEPQCATVAFSSVSRQNVTRFNWSGDAIVDLPLTRGMNLNAAIDTAKMLPFGGTDCAQPMLWAIENNVEADIFVIYTDNETWAGMVHPVQALDMYRQKTGIPAKLAVVAMTANDVSIADPNDPGMLDFVGLDSSTPAVLQSFASDNL